MKRRTFLGSIIAGIAAAFGVKPRADAADALLPPWGIHRGNTDPLWPRPLWADPPPVPPLTINKLRDAVAALRAADTMEIVWAQHDETGRWWQGMRRDIPARAQPRRRFA